MFFLVQRWLPPLGSTMECGTSAEQGSNVPDCGSFIHHSWTNVGVGRILTVKIPLAAVDPLGEALHFCG